MAKAWRTRRFLRVSHESPIILRVNFKHRKQVQLTQRNITGKMLDISEAGCGVETAFFIPRGIRLNVFMDRAQLQLKGEPALSGRSRIVGVCISSMTRGLKKYRIGMQFAWVSKQDKEILSKFVKFHERRKEPRVEL